jgi:lysozyme
MSLRTTKAGLDLIRGFENCHLKAYLCPAGVWTIGWGHTSEAGPPKVVPGMTITRQEADKIFAADVDRFENDVARLLKREARPHQFDAMVSLAYNIGIPKFQNSTVLARFNRGDFAGSAAAFGMWTKAKGRELNGLKRRRKAEAAMFRGETSVALANALNFNEPMPQRVDAPTPPKTMAKSKTGNAAIAVGLASIGSGVTAVKEASSVAQEAKDAAMQAASLLGVVDLSTAIIVSLSLLVVAGAAFIWWDRRRRLHEDMA